ncbi:MAG: SPASM domain-containing protein [Planctomycetota bacterium]
MNRVDAYVVVRETNPRGLPTLHREQLGGRPVLHWVCEALRRMETLRDIAVICDRIDPFLEDLRKRYGVRLHDSTLPDNPRRARMRRCRLWSATGWRGGIDYATAFDEDGWPEAFAAVQEAHPVDHVYHVGAEWPALDARLSDELVRHGIRMSADAHYIFHQAPPGFAGALISPRTVALMAGGRLLLRDALAVNHKGEDNQDEAKGTGNFEIPTALSRLSKRFTADTPRALRWLELLRASDPGLVPGLGSWEDWSEAASKHPFPPGPPPEVEWEWVTPSGQQVTPELFNRLSEELSSERDTLVTIDGRAPLTQHPDWVEMVRHLKARRIHGLHLRLGARDLSESVVTQLLSSPVDVISIRLDHEALSIPHTEQVERLCRGRNPQTGPLVVVEMVRRSELIASWESFWDRWVPLADQVVWRPPMKALGLFPPGNDLVLTRAPRRPCRRLSAETVIRADGTVALCREDWEDRHALGSVREESLESIRRRQEARWLRHAAGDWGTPCSSCDGWDSLAP